MEPINSGDKTTFFVRHNKEKQPPLRSGAEHIFSLRIQASSLLDVQPSSELLLEPLSSAENGGVLRKSHDVDEQDEDLNVRMENSATHVYEKNPGNELVHVKYSGKRITIQNSKEVEALGRKARERKEEEQRKRREIVRLEEEPDEGGGKKIAAPSFADAIRKQRPRPSSTLKRKAIEKFSDSFPESSTGTDVDPWIPSISHISLCSEGERSSVIRLHGLPQGVKPEAIRKFFAGLDAERVFVVLSNDSRVREWDERKHPRTLLVERHDPSFRVYVKFVSSPVADMAMARSGEILYVDGQEKKVGVRIGMTKISKMIANYLQQNMAIDGVNGSALEETLFREEARLGPRISSLLWTMAARDLNLQSSPHIPSLKDEGTLPWLNNLPKQNLLVFSNYQKLARHYNSLIEEYSTLEESSSSLNMNEWNPIFFTDSVIRMKRAALDRLLDEIESVKLMLYKARIERRQSVEAKDNDS